MQVYPFLAWSTPILAFCLSLILGVVLIPSLGLVNYTQIDFWLVWLLSMLILSLPLLILEIALAKRAKRLPLEAFVQLTREADRSVYWRLVGWTAVGFAVFLAGGVLNYAVQLWSSNQVLGIHAGIVLLLSSLLAVALSYVPRIILLSVTFCACIALLAFTITQVTSPVWYWSHFEFAEWGKVVILSIVTGGLCFGFYWHHTLEQVEQQQNTMPIALPIWFAQLLALALLSVFGSMISLFQTITFAIAAIGISALLIKFCLEQLRTRKVNFVAQALVICVPLSLWLIPQHLLNLNLIIILIALLIGLAYTVFVGWLMKISHLRKAINFSSELNYNLWRMMIRIVLPLSIMIALVSWLSTWVIA